MKLTNCLLIAGLAVLLCLSCNADRKAGPFPTESIDGDYHGMYTQYYHGNELTDPLVLTQEVDFTISGDHYTMTLAKNAPDRVVTDLVGWFEVLNGRVRLWDEGLLRPLPPVLPFGVYVFTRDGNLLHFIEDAIDGNGERRIRRIDLERAE